MNGFKKFILRGNVVELAVAVVIGIAFGILINSLVQNLLTPLIAIPGSTDFSDLTFSISGSTFAYGVFLNDLIGFVLIAAAVYFAVVLPLNRLAARRGATTKTCSECLTEIPIEARRCAACATVQPQVVPEPRSDTASTTESTV